MKNENMGRIVLRTKNNLSFAGLSRGTVSLEGSDYVWVTTCEESGFGVLCPTDFVEDIIKIELE